MRLTIALAAALLLQDGLATAQDAPIRTAQDAAAREVLPVFQGGRVQDLLSSVNTVVRETGAGASGTVSGLRSALDVRLPFVLESCDLKIGHEILRVAYGVVTDAPGASKTMRDLASDFARRDMGDFKGVTADCATALKGLGVAVTKVYLGPKWGDR